MNGLARLLVCSTFFAVCSPAVLAESISVTGNVSFDQTWLTFAPPFATQAGSGRFANFSYGNLNYVLGTVAYTNGVPQTELAFTITSATGDTLAFYDQANDPTKSLDAAGNLDVSLHETGYYTINGGAGLAGTFDLSFDGTSPDGSSSNVGFLGTGQFTEPDLTSNAVSATGVTPEPGSFLLLGTGLLGMAGFVRRTRTSVSV